MQRSRQREAIKQSQKGIPDGLDWDDANARFECRRYTAHIHLREAEVKELCTMSVLFFGPRRMIANPVGSLASLGLSKIIFLGP